MILALLLALQGASPETDAVMDRSRRQAAERRATAADAAAASRARSGADQPEYAMLPLAPDVARKLQACIDAAIADPVAGVKFASGWSLDAGGYTALQCRGFAHARAEQWDQAASAFDAAAAQAQKAGSSPDAARLWAQAGNAALAGASYQAAIGYFDSALANGMPDGLAKGEAFLDRGRANVALGRMAAARTDLDAAVRLAPQDPLGWLLSATLARRTNDMTRARTDIAEAVALAADDASVALEQGNIAMLTGDEATARTAWQRAVAHAPDGVAGKAARASLAQIDAASAPVADK